MTNELSEQVALFRYGLISPLLNNQVTSKKDYIAEICGKVHNVPYYGRKSFAPKTIESWLRDYRRGGFTALKPKGRSDKGSCRALKPEEKEHILELRKKYRFLSVVLFYEQLVRDATVTPDNVSYHTIYRLLKINNLLERDALPPKERKRFSYDKINILWQGDMSVGYYLIIGGKKYRTNLFVFLDDCSRLVPFGQFFFNEKFDCMKTVLQQALARRGIPKMIYVDNGKVYHAGQLHLACASLGITLTHTQPYDPQAKGKIERFFGTVRRRFYPLLTEKPPKTLEELNERFWQWLELDYHRKIHSGIDMCPLDLFMSQASTVRMVSDPSSLDMLFLKRDYRKVKHDATITLLNQIFEVPARLIGQKIEIRYDPSDLTILHIYENDTSIFTAKVVSFIDNAHTKRQRNDGQQEPISFERLLACKQEEN